MLVLDLRLICGLLFLFGIQNKKGMIPKGSFLESLEIGDLECIREYLEKGIDVNARVGNIYPLHISSVRGHSNVCRLLLESKADPNPPRVVAPPLVQAFSYGRISGCQESYLSIAKMLLYAGAEDETQKWKGYPIGKKLFQSKTSCRIALGAVYLVLKKQLRCSRDITRLIMDAVWNIRFEFTKDL